MSASTLTPVTQGDLTPILALLDRLSDVVSRLADGTREQDEARKIRVEAYELCKACRALPEPFSEQTGVQIPSATTTTESVAALLKRAEELPWNTFIERTPV